MGYLSDSLLYREACATVLPYEWEIDQVMKMFKHMNTAGIRMDPADVEAALLRARAA
jgi:hypothetical protein